MKKKIALAALFVGAIAIAQSRTITIQEGDVAVIGMHVAFLPDAGCLVRPAITVGVPGVRFDPQPRPFNGARCAAALTAATAAAKLDFGVGDGGVP